MINYKRPFRLQWLISTEPREWETSNGAFSKLDYAIKQAQKFDAYRVVHMGTHEIVWTNPQVAQP